MNRSITAQEVFDRLKDQFQLKWVAGENGASRQVDYSDAEQLRPSLAGFLNFIHPNNVQILGREEIDFLDSLDARQRWETIAKILAIRPTALILCEADMIPDDLLEGANESSTPLWTSNAAAVDLVAHLQHFMSRHLARETTVHGVFMEVFSLGVLITGDSGAGKSELAVELITRGHRLVADDAPLMTLAAPDIIDGSCPSVLKDCLEVRGLGVLNIRAMFGDSAIQTNKYLRLIIHLKVVNQKDIHKSTADRLTGDIGTREILGLEIPVINIPVAPGRNLAVLVEAAVRNHALKLKGYDAAMEFVSRHSATLANGDDST
ncbi:MAG: HPr(Ser) kinase/phosphatase [Xanthomonadales bacterium]|nr:HPr(Ser) kinase/phosphatase [Xanthomonadales bacterium]